jgi:hypothetical protein
MPPAISTTRSASAPVKTNLPAGADTARVVLAPGLVQVTSRTVGRASTEISQ